MLLQFQLQLSIVFLTRANYEVVHGKLMRTLRIGDRPSQKISYFLQNIIPGMDNLQDLEFTKNIRRRNPSDSEQHLNYFEETSQLYKFGVLLHKIFWFVVCFIFTVSILKLAVRFLATYLGVFKFILSEGSKMLSTILLAPFGGRDHWICILFGLQGQILLLGALSTLQTLCVYSSPQVGPANTGKPSQGLQEFPEKPFPLGCDREMCPSSRGSAA